MPVLSVLSSVLNLCDLRAFMQMFGIILASSLSTSQNAYCITQINIVDDSHASVKHGGRDSLLVRAPDS